MSDKQFTLLELHFNDGFQLGPRSLGDADELAEASDKSTTDAAEASSEGSGPSVFGPLLGLGILAGLAYAVRKLLAGVDPEGLGALDDIEKEFEDTADEPDEESVPIEITGPDEEADGNLARLVAGAAVLLVLFALGAKKLLRGSEEIVVED